MKVSFIVWMNPIYTDWVWITSCISACQNMKHNKFSRAAMSLFWRWTSFQKQHPLLAYILDIIVHHDQCNFYAGPTIMQPSVIQAFYEGKVNEEENMVIIHGYEIPFNTQEIYTVFQLRDNLDAEGNQLIASTSKRCLQNASCLRLTCRCTL